jgi:hypothetical protein
VEDAPAERGACGKSFVDVKRIHIARDLDEALQVGLGEGLGDAGMLAGLEVFNPFQRLSSASIDSG